MLAISSSLKAEVAAHGLCVWHCDWQFKNKDPVLAVVKINYVSAALLGPRLTYPIWGQGATADEAVRKALDSLEARQRAEGLRGALARLEAAVGALTYPLRAERWKIESQRPFGSYTQQELDDLDDDVPF